VGADEAGQAWVRTAPKRHRFGLVKPDLPPGADSGHLECAADIVECVTHSVSRGSDGGNNDDRYEGRDETILDGGRPRLVCRKIFDPTHVALPER